MHIVFAVLATGVGIACYVPYIRDIFLHKTTPHSYSWLIWVILQSVIIMAMVSGGAGLGVLSLVTGVIICGFVFILSFRYGTKNITNFDTACLIAAFGALTIYIFIHDALLSIVMVTLIDTVAFMPTFRKTHEEPYSETMTTYLFCSISSLLALGALSTFNITTSLFLVGQVVMNAISVGIIMTGRRRIIN